MKAFRGEGTNEFNNRVVSCGLATDFVVHSALCTTREKFVGYPEKCLGLEKMNPDVSGQRCPISMLARASTAMHIFSQKPSKPDSMRPLSAEHAPISVLRSWRTCRDRSSLEYNVGASSWKRIEQRVHLATDRNNEEIVAITAATNGTQGGQRVVRIPHTILASSLGVAPKLFDAWYNRHSVEATGGLHMVMEYFSCDMHGAPRLSDEGHSHGGCALQASGRAHARHGDNDMLCYDLKPSTSSSPWMARFPSFASSTLGATFASGSRLSHRARPSRCPGAHIHRKTRHRTRRRSITARTLYQELIFATMVIILSSNISFTLSQSERAARCSYADRGMLNFMSKAAADGGTRGSHVSLIREILRYLAFATRSVITWGIATAARSVSFRTRADLATRGLLAFDGSVSTPHFLPGKARWKRVNWWNALSTQALEPLTDCSHERGHAPSTPVPSCPHLAYVHDWSDEYLQNIERWHGSDDMRKSMSRWATWSRIPARASDYGPLSRLPSLMLKYLKDHTEMFGASFVLRIRSP